ncbi:helix-turn-helix transcriptional regulator [Clostridium sp. Ade.TY]|uniref:helix-turn-helix domain-containing protein n=1 Tax=Clostridium sp. Ade.TY TaxID=1391647 RepID=UPI000418AE9A|nr:helix-turn-helix transcriptional regulator [Clostridium sp. Ade.TY]
MEILSLGEKIKRKRKELNMTLKDLAKDRITPGQISLVESGRSNPSMDLLEYLAANLKTTVEYLMESEESQAHKVCTYYEQIAEAYMLNKNYDVSENYILKALEYAEKYNLEYKKGTLIRLKAKIYLRKEEFSLAQKSFLSANVIFTKNNNYREIIETFLNLAKITLQLKAYYSANSYLKQAEKVFLDNNISEDYLLGEIYFYLAKTYFAMDNIGRAMDYSFLAKEKLDIINNKEKHAETLLALSEECNNNGDLENAIKYSSETLKLYKEIEDVANISNVENELGKLFYNFENIDESFKRYEVSKNIRIQNNDKKITETLINICKNYLKVKDLKKCEEVLNSIYERLTEDNIEELIECNLIKYRMLIINEKNIEAEKVLLENYNIAMENHLLKILGELAIMIGKFYIDNKKEDEAKLYLNEGVSIFKEVGILAN